MEDVTYLPRVCPRCGKALAEDAAEGLCPACLLAAATETLTHATLDDALTVSARGDAPSRDRTGAQLTQGQSWGPYRIGRLLGRGGMGEVHEAEHVESGRRIALKVLRGRLQDADERARFLREGQLAASISHPHTVYIFGSEEIRGVPVISMELLPGGTLKDRVAAEGPLASPVAVAAVLDIIGGLDAAQAAGILHRDIKPSNCFVDSDGSVKVGDFGLSISTLARDVHEQLATGFEGTPQFAAPEQLRGEPLDVRADIYAVGATLYYLLTGQPPFDARDLRELVERVNNEAPRSPRLLRREIPSGLAAAILKCLAKAPAQRPSSYTALADMLRPFSILDETPAPIGARVLAAVVDLVIVSISFAISNAASGSIAVNGQSMSSPSPWTWVLNVVYFCVLEGWWGASLGKRLFGLRLSSPGGHLRASRFGAQGPGWLGRVARRTIVFHIPWLVIALVLVSFGPIGPAQDIQISEKWRLVAEDLRNLFEGMATLTLIGALFVTARRGNGWTGVHDLVSNTRVVLRTSARLRTRTAPSTTTLDSAIPVSRGPRYGPFIATTDSQDSNSDLVVGFDPVLRRHVWIHVVSPSTAPIAAARRDVSRTGRLHWLTGRRTGTENWDAFEAPDGRPLLQTIQGAAPQWSTLKSWLLDLSTELVASAADGSMPALRLDRLWIRDDGRLVLLDCPAPAPHAETTPALQDLSPMQLLSAVAKRATVSEDSRALMPLSASTLLRSWSHQTPPSLTDAHAALVRAAAAPDSVRRARRALPMGLASGPPVLVVTIIVLFTLPTMNRLFGPDTTEMLDLLRLISNPNPPPGSRVTAPDVRLAIETYLAGRHGRRLTDTGLWNHPAMQEVSERLRPTAEDVAARHPSVSAEELARATTTIAPELESERQRRAGRNFSSTGPVIIVAVAAFAFVALILLSVVSSLIVPGGLFTRMLGYAVVWRDGTEIGRLMSLARVLVAWAPAIAWLIYLAASPKVQGFVPVPSSPLTGMVLTLVTLGVGACLTILRPAQGPHDWLLGTRVVPR